MPLLYSKIYYVCSSIKQDIMILKETQTHKSMKQNGHKYARHFFAKSQEQLNVGKIAFSTMVLEQLGMYT